MVPGSIFKITRGKQFPLENDHFNEEGIFFDLNLLQKDAFDQINDKIQYGETPLHRAAHNGHREIVKFLLDHGADTTLTNRDGETALDLAESDGIKKLFPDHHAQSKSSKTIGAIEHKDGH
jgi:ankyrin repeat protein